MTGRRPVIATQTLAELLLWPELNRWQTARRSRLNAILDSTPVVPVTREVVDAYVDLTADCRDHGHALRAKEHTGDRWVAATAIAIGRPLLALDGIYHDAPGLAVL